jgi:hypothetical protein
MEKIMRPAGGKSKGALNLAVLSNEVEHFSGLCAAELDIAVETDRLCVSAHPSRDLRRKIWCANRAGSRHQCRG